jgi:hypothetical protein
MHGGDARLHAGEEHSREAEAGEGVTTARPRKNAVDDSIGRKKHRDPSGFSKQPKEMHEVRP